MIDRIRASFLSGTALAAGLLLLFLGSVRAGNGDTTWVQTFTFGSPQDAWFRFPDSSHSYRKILMYYTLKCNPAQSPACGEWDYLTYTYFYRHTGIYDSTLYTHPNFSAYGTFPDSLQVMNEPSYKYVPWLEFTNQTPVSDSALIGAGSLAPVTGPFSTEATDCRTQYLWRASEITSDGIAAGQITGLRLNFSQAGGLLHKLTIRVKATALDSLSTASYEQSGFTEVFRQNLLVADTGWQVFPFAWPYIWDGTSNLVIDISYIAHDAPWTNTVKGDDAGFTSTVCSWKKDGFLEFEDNDCMTIPKQAFSNIDSAITIAFWCYGDPLRQPQDQYTLEGIDSTGQRVLCVHLPWSDTRIYWDAGRDSTGYDRISQKVSDPNLYRGRWNFWAFTKDVSTGRMKIYYNGQFWALGAGKTKSMTGIDRFRIGGSGTGDGPYYDGMIDNFSVWDKALSDTALRRIMYRDIDPSDPEYSHLAASFTFDEGDGVVTHDSGPGNYTATLSGYPEWMNYQGKDRFRNFTESTSRPAVILEQGVYDPLSLDSVVKVDTVQKPPVMITLYSDTLHPYLPMDSLLRWPAYYNGYQYDASGHATDSTFVIPDSTLHRHDYPYYGDPFEILERYELARYITPYGNNLSLGDGWTWVYDLTDYAPLLKDSVHLSAGNWQELLDMKFALVEGKPTRNVKSVTNIYTGAHGYDKAESHNLPPVRAYIAPDVSGARLKMRITGHGFGGNLDCSEFCPRNNKLFINGNLAYNHRVWRDDCGLNPLYPQGGTWLYDRAEWCPGAEVRTRDFELTQFVTPGDSLTIDYDLQQGYTWNGQGSWPYYVIESQLITYGAMNYSLNVSMEEILAPNKEKFYLRQNPMCGQPVIRIRNNGSSPVTSMDIAYGPEGVPPQVYHWTGDLQFPDTLTITLPPIDWTGWEGGNNRFTVTLDNPNSQADEDPADNTMSSNFDIPPTFDPAFILKMKTNHQAGAISWWVSDEDGTVLVQNGPLENNTVYSDTFHLTRGCYRLHIRNAQGEGLKYWANMPPYGNGTAGYANLYKMDGTILKSIQPDFGRETAISFTEGMSIEVPEIYPDGYVTVFPNPADDAVHVMLGYDTPQRILLTLLNVFGQEVGSKELNGVTKAETKFSLSGLPAGTYVLLIQSNAGILQRKVIHR